MARGGAQLWAEHGNQPTPPRQQASGGGGSGATWARGPGQGFPRHKHVGTHSCGPCVGRAPPGLPTLRQSVRSGEAFLSEPLEADLTLSPTMVWAVSPSGRAQRGSV